MKSYDTLKRIASQYYPLNAEGAVMTARDLLVAASRFNGTNFPITDDMLVEWYRGRGMVSSAKMSKPRSRKTWLAFAKSVLAP